MSICRIKSSRLKYVWKIILDDCSTEHIIVEHYNDPVAVVLSWSEYQKLIANTQCATPTNEKEKQNE